MLSTDELIIAALLNKPDFVDIAFPHLKAEYFTGHQKAVFEVTKTYYDKYSVMPTKTALLNEVAEFKNWKEEEGAKVIRFVETLFDPGNFFNENLQWLVETAEKFCKEQSVFNAIARCIAIYEGEDKKTPISSIPDIMKEAVSVEFNTNIGHDWLEDAEQRYEFYHNPVAAIPFDIEVLNDITGGRGLTRKTLNVILAGINCGKTGFMCHLAAGYAKMGYHVLYITLEMQEEKIALRLDANIFNVPMHDIKRMEKADYISKIDAINQKTFGKIIVKEYPTGSAHAGHFAHTLNELKAKKNFIPDVIVVDYIGICASSRVGLNGVNSYQYLKYVSEELRALAFNYDAVVWTGVQLNRSGFDSEDVDMTDVADSFGIPATADTILALTRTEQLDELSQVLIKQVKNRDDDKNRRPRFVLGVDQGKQQYYDVEQTTYQKQKSTARVVGTQSMNSAVKEMSATSKRKVSLKDLR